MNGLINIREEAIKRGQLEAQINHDYRTRKDLKNVDYSKSQNNTYELLAEELREVIKEQEEEHKQRYLKRYKRKPQEEKTRTFKRGVLTVPADYQEHLKNGKFDNEKLLEMFEEFKKKYKEETGREIFAYVLHLEDEKTFHFHYYAQNFNEQGSSKKVKGQGSKLQDIGGEAFASIGLKRGIPKEETGAEHMGNREHYNKLLNHSEVIEQWLESDELTKEDLDYLIKNAVKPIKTVLIYVKRALTIEADANKVLKNQKLALAKVSKALPKVKSINDFNGLVDYIIKNKTELRAKTYSPEPEK